MNELRWAMRHDPEYAWSWHANLCMMAFDAGAPIHEADQRADSFMRMAFDVRTLELFPDRAHKAPTSLPEAPAPAAGEVPEGWRKLLHAAYHLIDDSEEGAQTDVYSIDNGIAADDLKAMADALALLGVERHDDIDRALLTAPQAPQQAVEVEPVAWRVRDVHYINHERGVSDWRIHPHPRKPIWPDCEYEPLYTHPQPPSQMQWRSISEAPKDETIMLWSVALGVDCGSWDEGCAGEYVEGMQVSSGVEEGFYGNRHHPAEPATHWQPLPPPPTPEPQGGKS